MVHILGEMASIQTLSGNFRKISTTLCIGLLQIAKVVELAKNRKILELSSFEGAEQPLYNTYRTLQLVDIPSEAKLYISRPSAIDSDSLKPLSGLHSK